MLWMLLEIIIKAIPPSSTIITNKQVRILLKIILECNKKLIKNCNNNPYLKRG